MLIRSGMPRVSTPGGARALGYLSSSSSSQYHRLARPALLHRRHISSVSDVHLHQRRTRAHLFNSPEYQQVNHHHQLRSFHVGGLHDERLQHQKRSEVTTVLPWRKKTTARGHPQIRHASSKSSASTAAAGGKWSGANVWKMVKEGVKHTYHSLKLLASNTRIAMGLVKKMSDNHPLTRREQKLLYMTTFDLLRMVPFSFFIIIPGAEVLLPVALKLYPGLLPSTFSTEEEESKKLIASFPTRFRYRKDLRDHLAQLAKDRELEDDAGLRAFMQGEPVDTEIVRDVAMKLEDALTVDKLPRSVLIAACHTMGISTRFGIAPFIPINQPDKLLRDKLMRHLNRLRYDDAAIIAEGLDKLSLEDLKEDNRERCMQEHTTESNLRKQLRMWTKLSMGSEDSGRTDAVNISFLIFLQPRADHFWNSIHNMPQYVIDTVLKAKDTPPEVIRQLSMVVSMPEKELESVLDRLEDKPELPDVQLRLGRLLLQAKARGVKLRRAFALFDLDRDGRLSKQEIKEAMAELNVSVSKKELAVLFKNYDTDFDGKISIKEFTRVARDADTIAAKVNEALSIAPPPVVEEGAEGLVTTESGALEVSGDMEVEIAESADAEVSKRLDLLLEEERLMREEDEQDEVEMEAKKERRRVKRELKKEQERIEREELLIEAATPTAVEADEITTKATEEVQEKEKKEEANK